MIQEQHSSCPVLGVVSANYGALGQAMGAPDSYWAGEKHRSQSGAYHWRQRWGASYRAELSTVAPALASVSVKVQ